MKEKSQYEIDKDKNKEKLVRNEFLYNGNSQSKYEFPKIKKQNIDVNKIKFLSYVDSKKEDEENKNVLGFSSNDFKYFKYDDPGEKTNIKKCDVCESPCLIDEYGNGICEKCNWNQGGSLLEKQYKVGYPNLIPLSKAKKLYQLNKDFKPDFEDFVNDLLFYGEMEFEFNNTMYVVDRYTDKFEIHVCKVGDYENRQIFKSVNEFISKAKVNDILLKDVWKNIKNINWQS